METQTDCANLKEFELNFGVSLDEIFFDIFISHQSIAKHQSKFFSAAIENLDDE